MNARSRRSQSAASLCRARRGPARLRPRSSRPRPRFFATRASLAVWAAARWDREEVTLARAEEQGEALRDHLRCHPAVGAVELAGAFRRRVETIDRREAVFFGILFNLRRDPLVPARQRR